MPSSTDTKITGFSTWWLPVVLSREVVIEVGGAVLSQSRNVRGMRAPFIRVKYASVRLVV